MTSEVRNVTSQNIQISNTFFFNRVHHKFTETDADPHNARRGFFFSHIGWLMVRKHKEVFEKGASVDMSDLEKDPIVMFQKK